MANPEPLRPDQQELLDQLSSREFKSGKPTPLADILLAAPPEDEARLRRTLTELARGGHVEVAGHEGSELVHLTRTGALASASAGDWDGVGRKLIGYLRERLAAEGSRFAEYTWTDLKAAGLVEGDGQFGSVLRTLQLFSMYSGGSYVFEPPAFSFKLPPYKVKFREVDSLAGLTALLEQRERRFRPPVDHAATGAESSKAKMKKNVFGERWTIVGTVGEGGQGQVFEVEDGRGGPNRILKRLKNIKRLERFAAELKAIQRIDHPNVIKLIDHDLEGERPYLVMELVGDGSLDKHLGVVASEPLRALRLFEEVCGGVQAAHAAGVVHRDLKPENILLRGAFGPPVVADFGICHIEDGERLTLTEEAVGPRLYMAPELEDGRAEAIHPASDVYSLGKLLWAMLAGKQVFAREKHRDASNNLVQLLHRDSMEHVNRLLDRMIVVAPEARLPDAGEVVSSLRRVIDLITFDYRAVSAKLSQRCTYCGEGTYRLVAKEDGVSVRNFGLGLVGKPDWRVLVCDACGHVEMFRIEKATRKDWWDE
ncbi:MAG: serine/threonine protein kinase [Polyangiaceae bacterium]|nr:serine/threonine protein kinase [Polyangiaceae bacterium]